MTVLYLARRNLRVFFRDRASVFFSLLAVFIIIGLYVLFLGDVIVSGMSGMGGGVRSLIDSWIMAGLLAATSMTTTLGAFGIMIEDDARKIRKDFMASPVRRSALAGGYVIGALIIGLVLCLVTLALAEAYILAYGGSLLAPAALARVLGVLVLSVFSSSSMVFFVATFIHTTNAFGTLSTIVGTLIGFITGIYIPIGNLPESVQTVVKLFPVSYSGTLFRRIMMEKPLADVFSGAPAGALEKFETDMGVVFRFGAHEMSAAESVGILLATTVIFYGLAILNLSRKRR